MDIGQRSPGGAESGARSGKSYNGSKVLCPNPALNGEIRKLIPTHSTEFRSHRLDWQLTCTERAVKLDNSF